jgi:eukaryotic-like serine/threonine-protein kinase
VNQLGREEVLFSTALALPSAERDFYLERACADCDSHARVRALLGACDRSHRLIQEGAVAYPSEAARARVDNFRVLEDLGEGGWGSVYRAEQVSPLRREVALKVLKLGMDTKAVIIRFEAERQALAMMDHPNIAKVFDAGATDAGRPYFAMELVRGVKITQYCDSIRASVSERLGLFVQVCQAIQHAHRKGIVHRDIKPSNVMVTLCDGEAVVKVIDFGVAKALESGPPENTMLTVFGAFVGTPAYVSPEQMDYGARIDARSDIYSLGVLLHELLCGCTPFSVGDLSPSALHILRGRVRSEEPQLPSKLLSTLSTQSILRIAECCRTTRSKLVGQLQGDLDWIIIRCLEKDPARRYQSARDLSLDLQRYLRDEPVVARPQRLFYSLRKFAKRHRTVVVTGAMVITVLLITSSLASWVAVRATRATRLAQDVALFLQNDLLVQDTPDLQLQTLLDRAATKVGERFADEPLVEASIRDILGTAYDSIDARSKSRSQLERALSIYDAEYGATHPRTLGAMIKVATSAAKQAQFDEAERLGMRALRHSRRDLDGKDVEMLALLTTLATVLLEQGRTAESLGMLNDVISIQKSLGPEHPTTLQSSLLLARIRIKQGDLPRAEALARQVLEASIRTRGFEHPTSRKAAETLYTILKQSGKCDPVHDIKGTPSDNDFAKASHLRRVPPSQYEPYPNLWDCHPERSTATVR